MKLEKKKKLLGVTQVQKFGIGAGFGAPVLTSHQKTF